jgi:hypothetical protein
MENSIIYIYIYIYIRGCNMPRLQYDKDTRLQYANVAIYNMCRYAATICQGFAIGQSSRLGVVQ